MLLKICSMEKWPTGKLSERKITILIKTRVFVTRVYPYQMSEVAFEISGLQSPECIMLKRLIQFFIRSILKDHLRSNLGRIFPKTTKNSKFEHGNSLDEGQDKEKNSKPVFGV